jgi:predicted transcriptional regulator
VAAGRAEHGELQSRVLAVVRERGQCTVRDVHESLSSGRAVAYTTVLTVMSRLVERGLLARTREGKAGVFSIAVSNDSEAAGQVVEQLLGRFGTVAVSEFVAHAKDDPALLAELRRLVDGDA